MAPKKIGKKSEESEYFGMYEYFGGVRILRRSPNTSEESEYFGKTEYFGGTEYFGSNRILRSEAIF